MSLCLWSELVYPQIVIKTQAWFAISIADRLVQWGWADQSYSSSSFSGPPFTLKFSLLSLLKKPLSLWELTQIVCVSGVYVNPLTKFSGNILDTQIQLLGWKSVLFSVAVLMIWPDFGFWLHLVVVLARCSTKVCLEHCGNFVTCTVLVLCCVWDQWGQVWFSRF